MVKNILAIGAHPDDVEFCCAGTLIRHVKEGDKVFILHMSNSGYKNTITGEVLRTKRQCEEEAFESANIIGCNFILLDNEEQNVKFDLETITEIEKIIIENKIEIVYTHGNNEAHQSHIATNRAVMAASRSVQNIFTFEQLPLPRTRVTDNPSFYVDITDYFDTKIKASEAYKSQVGDKYGPTLIEAITSLSRFRGSQCGVQYAEAFTAIKQTKFLNK